MSEWNGHVFPDKPPGWRGCVTCACGQVRANLGPVTVNPSLEAQKRAGEEDQSVPGWDFGA